MPPCSHRSAPAPPEARASLPNPPPVASAFSSGLSNAPRFARAPAWRALPPLRRQGKVAKLRDPESRATMVREALDDPPPIDFSQIFLLPDGEARYDHRPDESLQAHARRLGVSPAEA